MNYRYGNIRCSRDTRKNVLEYRSRFFQIEPLSLITHNSKGGNSNVFKLYDPNDDVYYIIKFCKFPLNSNKDRLKRRIQRFQNEIMALKKAKGSGAQYIIDYQFHGKMTIDNRAFEYCVTELGAMDLTEYLASNEFTDQQIILLCSEIINGLLELHSLGIYHRDIKPDNVFIVDGKCKIGDLGLVAFRDDEQSADVLSEKIGPYGWLSPEAMNKVLCETTPWAEVHDCKIDSKSDVFQLGKLMWYIFQRNIPIGLTNRADMIHADSDLYDLVSSMLKYSKRKRPSLDNVSKKLRLTFSRYGI